MPARKEILEVAGREVTITNADKVFFPRTGHTKLDLVRYYLAVAEGALRGVAGRPMALKRFVDGAEGEFFFQKRAPKSRPEWIETVELSFPSGRTASEVVVRDAAQLAWVVNLGCIDLNPHPVRADDLDHPDELRVDLDPVPGVRWSQIREVALVTKEALEDLGLVGWPKTSGSRGFHIYCRIEPRWTFTEVRRAAVALARDVERRAPDLATSKWWKEERHGVFLDYNQNAKDRTVASAHSARPTPDARVSAPLTWEEVPDCDPAAFTIDTVPERFAGIGDPWEGMDRASGSLDPLLELAATHEAAGFADAPWPPQFAKQPGEPPRVQPSKRRRSAGPPAPEGVVPPPAPGKATGPTGRRRTTMPLIEIARAATEAEGKEGLERWKKRHPTVSSYLAPADVLVDSMRGRSTTWTRIRVNLRNVPEAKRPPQEALEVDYDPWEGYDWPERSPGDQQGEGRAPQTSRGSPISGDRTRGGGNMPVRPTIDVYLEVGTKRVFAGAIDWPGWCRSGRDEDAALEALVAYGPRFAGAVGRAARGFKAPAEASSLHLVERLDGNATTDFGAPAVAPTSDQRPLDEAELQRLVGLLKACWRKFDRAAKAASGAVLRKGPRGGGRELEAIVSHVLDADAAYLSRLGGKYGKADESDVKTEMARLRTVVLDALSARARGEPLANPSRSRTIWAPRYAIRRSAWHALDHAWEVEDRRG